MADHLGVVPPVEAVAVSADGAVTCGLMIMTAARVLEAAIAQADVGGVAGALHRLKKFRKPAALKADG